MDDRCESRADKPLEAAFRIFRFMFWFFLGLVFQRSNGQRSPAAAQDRIGGRLVQRVLGCTLELPLSRIRILVPVFPDRSLSEIFHCLPDATKTLHQWSLLI